MTEIMATVPVGIGEVTRGKVTVTRGKREMTRGNSTRTENIATVPVGIGEVTRGKVTVTRGISDTSVGISEKTVARSETFISKREACGAVRVSYSDNFEIIRARTEQTISRSASIVARFKHDFLVIGYDQKVMLGAAGDRLSNVSH